jgi:hypothetical protein
MLTIGQKTTAPVKKFLLICGLQWAPLLVPART